MIRAVTGAISVLVLSLAGCGRDEERGSPAEPTGRGPVRPPASSKLIAVSETEFRLDPANPKVKAGTVAFSVRNDGKVVHALEIEAPSGEVETPEIQPGRSATLTAKLTKRGKYKWYCPIDGHEGLGMTGQITVTGGADPGRRRTGASGGTEPRSSSGRGGRGSYSDGGRPSPGGGAPGD